MPSPEYSPPHADSDPPSPLHFIPLAVLSYPPNLPGTALPSLTGKNLITLPTDNLRCKRIPLCIIRIIGNCETSSES